MKGRKTLQKVFQKSSLFLKCHSPTILTGIGAIGVITTAVMAVKATPKALELIEDKEHETPGVFAHLTPIEKIKAAWTCYIPTIIVGTSTIACIFGANVLNRKQQASLLSAYALLNNSYKEYKDKLKELYGEETHRKIMESLCVEKAKNANVTAIGGVMGNCISSDFEDAYEEEMLFYDNLSKRYFQSTISKVLQAEYHLNRNFVIGGCVSLNDYYEFLGLEKTEYGETVRWNNFDGYYYWIDFNHQKVELDDGLECYIIDVMFDPDVGYNEDI